MCCFRLHVDLGAAAPDHDHSREVVRLAELVDVVHDLFGKFHLVLAGLHVGTLQTFDVVLAENGFPRLDFFDFRTNGIQQRFFEHAGFQGAFVAVVFVDIPAAEDQVVETGERNKILDLRNPAFRAFSEPDGSELSQRADRAARSSS